MVLAYAARSQVKTSVRIGTASLHIGIWSAPYSIQYANLIGIREMSERANDQLADLIGSEYNGHMQAGIASVTPDSRHIRLFREDWPLCIFC